MGENANEVVFSFIASDQAFYEQIRQHLAPLRRLGKIIIWSLPDTQNEAEIRQHLESARIIVVLISSAYLDSDYHYDVVLMRALERHRAGKAILLPILARRCHYERLPFASMQMLPPNGIPLSTLAEEPRDQACYEIARAIDMIIKHISRRNPPAP